MCHAFEKVFSISILEYLCLSACSLNLLCSALAELSSLDSQLLFQLTVAKYLYSVIQLLNQTALNQCLLIYNCAIFESVQILNIDLSIYSSEMICESSDRKSVV